MLEFYYLKEIWNIPMETTGKIFRSNVMGVVQPTGGKIMLLVQHFWMLLNIHFSYKNIEFDTNI